MWFSALLASRHHATEHIVAGTMHLLQNTIDLPLNLDSESKPRKKSIQLIFAFVCTGYIPTFSQMFSR